MRYVNFQICVLVIPIIYPVIEDKLQQINDAIS